jgi:ribosomal protein S12 methylthiotransferase accessory factor
MVPRVLAVRACSRRGVAGMTASAPAPAHGRILDLVSSRVGVVRDLAHVVRGPAEPEPPIIYQAFLSHFDFKKGKVSDRGAIGKGETAAEAMAGAVGEALERYCASHPDAALMRRASYAALQRAAIAPTEFVLYSDSQYANSRFGWPRWTADRALSGLPGRALPGPDNALVPASFVYMTYAGERPEEFLCPSTSNGLAAGSDLPSAILHGLLELIERDAFLVTWMNRLTPTQVDVSADRGTSGRIVAHYAHFGVDVRVFDISVDLLPYTMMAIAFDSHGAGPAAVVGLGCHLDPAVAVRRALFEVCQVRPAQARRMLDDPPAARLRSYEQVRALEDHASYFAMSEHLPELDFVLKSDRTTPVAALPDKSVSVARDLDACVGALGEAGSRVFYAELTTPDVRDFGVAVVRVLATGLQPIHFGHGEERLGGRRLYDVPVKLGFAAAPRTAADLNPCPHPLA